MPQYIFTYRSAKNYNALADPDGLAAWTSFIKRCHRTEHHGPRLAGLQASDRARRSG